MKIVFSKYHGCGNDFILVNEASFPLSILSDFSASSLFSSELFISFSDFFPLFSAFLCVISKKLSCPSEFFSSSSVKRLTLPYSPSNPALSMTLPSLSLFTPSATELPAALFISDIEASLKIKNSGPRDDSISSQHSRTFALSGDFPHDAPMTSLRGIRHSKGFASGCL